MATVVGNRHRVGRATRISCRKPCNPPGVWGVGTRFFRTGCTVLWQLSQNLVGSEFTIPRPFPCAVHGGTVAALMAGNKYRQVAEKGELSVITRYSCSTSTPINFYTCRGNNYAQAPCYEHWNAQVLSSVLCAPARVGRGALPRPESALNALKKRSLKALCAVHLVAGSTTSPVQAQIPRSGLARPLVNASVERFSRTHHVFTCILLQSSISHRLFGCI